MATCILHSEDGAPEPPTTLPSRSMYTRSEGLSRGLGADVGVMATRSPTLTLMFPLRRVVWPRR